MKVGKIMTKAVEWVSPGDTLRNAAEIMKRRDCGLVPIIDNGKVVSVVTDRDIALAAGVQDRRLSEMNVGDAAGGEPVICSKDESIESALKKMRKFGIRRILVASRDGELEGIVSIADIVRIAKGRKSLRKQVFKTLVSLSVAGPIILKEIE